MITVTRYTAIIKVAVIRKLPLLQHVHSDTLERKTHIMITLNVALLLLRLMVGLTLAFHGTQKLFGWFGGHGLARLRQVFEKQGYKPVWLWASLVILGEVGGGVSLVLGFLTPLGAA